MKSTNSKDPFGELIECLRRDGLNEEAEKIRFLMDDVAWTSSSELLGELGKELLRIKKTGMRRLSDESKSKLSASLNVVRKTWPDISI